MPRPREDTDAEKILKTAIRHSVHGRNCHGPLALAGVLADLTGQARPDSNGNVESGDGANPESWTGVGFGIAATQGRTPADGMPRGGRKAASVVCVDPSTEGCPRGQMAK